jgi:hypothetical protein
MKDLSNYGEYELFSHLYDKIISREISAFSELRDYTVSITGNPKTKPVLLRAFELIKQLNWGFFASLSRTQHPKLWRELVLPDRQFIEAGDLKKTITISTLYAAMLDIHGYTKFCQDSRNNIALLHTLDRAITRDIQNICSQCNALSRREQGDNIVVIAASASDALTAALGIVDYFSNVKTLRNPQLNTLRSEDAASLPVFKISGGITGGKIPMIITEEGNLAGTLLNTAARLQSRSNELSPRESKVMLTKKVYLTAQEEHTAIFRDKELFFFDTGPIEFKGVLLPTCELIFNPKDAYKAQYQGELLSLIEAIKEGHWEQRVYLDLLSLMSKAAISMPRFKISLKQPIDGVMDITNELFDHTCKIASGVYCNDNDYFYAVELLSHCIQIMEATPDFDRLILDYARAVLDKYRTLLRRYEELIDKQVDANLVNIFDAQRLKVYNAASDSIGLYEKLRDAARNSPFMKKKELWKALIAQNREKLSVTIYSGKK